MATPTQQYIQLMTKRYHLCLKRLSRTEEVDDHPLEQIQELEHPEFMARFGPSRQADGICDRDKPILALFCRSDNCRRKRGTRAPRCSGCTRSGVLFDRRIQAHEIAGSKRKTPFSTVSAGSRPAAFCPENAERAFA